jgi:hypothetical protein
VSRLEKAALEIHRVLWNNTGHTDEWPIQIQCDDEILTCFADAMNELRNAAEEAEPGIGAWPVKSKEINN